MEKLIGRALYQDRECFITPDETDENFVFLLTGDFDQGFVKQKQRIQVKDIKFDLPFKPGKLFGIGKNYPSEETPNENINFFIMAHNALLAHASPLVLSRRIGSLIPEGELAVVISKTIKDVSPFEAQDAILGYTICNDYSAREINPADAPVAIKKSSDGLLPMGPYLLLDSSVREFEIRTFKNNELLQFGSTTGMFNKIPELISYISSFMTLNKFDLISTGTPGPKILAHRGDVVRVEIEGIGMLENAIV